MKPYKKNHRYPTEIIQKSLELYYSSSTISFRDVEQMLANEGIYVSYKTIRDWHLKFRDEIKTEKPNNK